MRSDVIRQMTVAIAVSVPQDIVAFEMLQQDYIDEFNKYYQERRRKLARDGERVLPNILDEMINFAIRELPIRQINCQSLSGLLEEVKKTEIKNRFLTQTTVQMLTALAKRDKVRESVRQYLHSQDNRNTHSNIDSTKLEHIFNMFIKMFEESSAAAFAFSGTFLDYVMHCFIRFFYPSHRKDVWSILGAVDFAKREAETNITSVKISTVTRTDDIPIRGLLINIAEVNDLMFNHSGQSEDARGVSYDIYYMIIVYLCQRQVDEINAQLQGFQLQLIDERDRKESRNGLVENKGIANKISNARMLIPIIFEYVRKGEWNIDNITELRDIAFELGKKDRDGKNCVWKDVQDKAETSRYFDMRTSPHNYRAFDKIFKGVLSVYALMKAMEERGKFVIDIYDKNPKLCEDKRIPRSVDYLSALDYLDLLLELEDNGAEPRNIRDLQHPNAPQGELLKFNEMVYLYAGSEQNNHENIRMNRKHAFSRGLLDNPRLKQSGNFQSPFERLQSAADFITSVPRGFEEYIMLMLGEERPLPQYYAPQVVLSPSDVTLGHFSSLYHNKFMTENSDIAKYYLYRLANNQAQLQSLEWHIGSAMLPSVLYEQVVPDQNGGSQIARVFCMYVPIMDTFLCCPFDTDTTDTSRLQSQKLHQLQLLVNEHTYNGQRNAQISMLYLDIPKAMYNPFLRVGMGLNGDSREDAMRRSLGFDSYLGIENYATPDVLAKMKAFDVYFEYRPTVERYISWMDVLSRVQHSYIDLLYAMLSFGLFAARTSSGGISEVDAKQGHILVDSLLKSEFTEFNLQWFFECLEAARSSVNLTKVDMQWGSNPTSPVEFAPLDLSCMDIINNTVKNDFPRESLMYNLMHALADYETPAQRFVQLYNFINAKLSFLRVLRDAYDLTFNVVAAGLGTLGCELNSRFGIESALTSGKDNVGQGGMLDSKFALVDSIPTESLIHFIGDVRQDNWKNFQVLCDGLLDYFKSCRQEISDLVDYDVTSSTSMRSKFLEWGSAFYALPIYTDSIVTDSISDIKAKYRTDDAGFLMCRASYFRGRSGSSEYYLHVTGRMVEVSSGHTGPASFDFSREEDKKLYTEIIKDGKSRDGW